MRTSCEIFVTSGTKRLDIDECGDWIETFLDGEGGDSIASTTSLNDDQKSVASFLLEAFRRLPESEREIQSEISSEFTNKFDAADTNDTQFFYNNMLDTSLSVDRSSKPDMASIYFPLFLEIKKGGKCGNAVAKTFELLTQCFMRACSIGSNFQSIIKNTVVIGTDGNFVFRVIFAANEPSRIKNSEYKVHRLSLEKFDISQLLLLWVEAQSRGNDYFFDPLRHALLSFYSQLKINWQLTRSVKFDEGRSDRNVLLKVYQSKDGKSIDCSNIEFVLKICASPLKEFNEAIAVKELESEYVYSVMNEGNVTILNKDACSKKESVSIEYTEKQLEIASKIKWINDLPRDENKGKEASIIMMAHIAESLSDREAIIRENNEWESVVFRDISRTLLKAHKLGIVHCDIRRGNIMYYNGKFTLIDFDLSSRLKEKIIMLRGDRYNLRPFSLVHFSADEQVLWTPQDDFSMLAELLLRMRVRLKLYLTSHSLFLVITL